MNSTLPSFFFRLTLGVCVIIVVYALAGTAQATKLFNSSETLSYELHHFPKWNAVITKEPNSRTKKCSDGACTSKSWQQQMSEMNVSQQSVASLKAVNNYFNKVPYIQDMQNWGQNDYWAIPLQFLVRNGDCEDYAIAKYMALRQQGWPSKNLRIVVLQDQNLGILHSVLLVSLNGKNYILDNQIKQLLTDRQIYHYQPIFSINEKAWWRHHNS